MEPIQATLNVPRDAYFDQDVERIIMEEEFILPMITDSEPGCILDPLPEA